MLLYIYIYTYTHYICTLYIYAIDNMYICNWLFRFFVFSLSLSLHVYTYMLCMCCTYLFYINNIHIICHTHTMYAHCIHYPYFDIHAHTSLYIQRVNIHYRTCACFNYTMYIYIYAHMYVYIYTYAVNMHALTC